ncbi:MAG: hypothetical protein IT311_03665 [Anaerolineales bacterium]|nr:hypothetical protein [Anaerolineales bacterium]MCZ2121404.1 hypothetical protein [Anaerolineales bacterium]
MFRKINILCCSFLIVACAQNVPPPPASIKTVETPTTQIIATHPEVAPTSTPIVSQTQNGVTATITWAYSDETRLAFEVHISGVEAPAGYELPCPINKISVSDQQGYPYAEYERFNSESRELFAHCVFQSDLNEYIFTYIFYHHRADFQEVKATATILLGNFELISENGQSTLLPDLGTYSFPLTFSANLELTLFPKLTVENTAATVSLNQVEINPTFTSADLCVQLEDRHDWSFDLSILANNENIPASPELTLWTNYNSALDESQNLNAFRCYKLIFPIALIENSTLQATNIEIELNQIVIDYTNGLTQEKCAEIRNKVQSIYPDLDFTCHLEHGFGLEIKQTPSGMSADTAYQIVTENFKESIYGPWEFSIHLP